MFPERRGALNVSDGAIRLTPDGRLLVVGTLETGSDISALAVPDGQPRGCARHAIAALRSPPAGEGLWFIEAVAEDGRWCVLHSFPAGNNDTHGLELWSAAPLRQVTRVTLSSQSGHVRSAAAPRGALAGCLRPPAVRRCIDGGRAPLAGRRRRAGR